jgi:hypothetical protein
MRNEGEMGFRRLRLCRGDELGYWTDGDRFGGPASHRVTYVESKRDKKSGENWTSNGRFCILKVGTDLRIHGMFFCVRWIDGFPDWCNGSINLPVLGIEW